SLDKSNLMTRYEHFISSSGIGIPPDPFKILRLYGTNPDLEYVIEARKKAFPNGEKRKIIFGSTHFPGFRELTGLYPEDCLVEYVNPQVESDGRVQIPEVIAFYDFESRRIELSDLVRSQLQFPTTDEFKIKPNLKIREVFDYKGGYRLELVP
ncbi:hypothetical protein HYX03_04550, partial [Candidatus Woesearchaeota archaeon]|nr:hypothetical protein [Candidatus Woesearchaeota archaeon]